MPSLREQGPWANLGRMGVAKFFLLILSASQILSARGEGESIIHVLFGKIFRVIWNRVNNVINFKCGNLYASFIT